jgi:hypothetical protein
VTAIPNLLLLLFEWNYFVRDHLINFKLVSWKRLVGNGRRIVISLHKVIVQFAKFTAAPKNCSFFVIDGFLERFHTYLTELRVKEVEALVPVSNFIVEVFRCNAV